MASIATTKNALQKQINNASFQIEKQTKKRKALIEKLNQIEAVEEKQKTKLSKTERNVLLRKLQERKKLFQEGQEKFMTNVVPVLEKYAAASLQQNSLPNGGDSSSAITAMPEMDYQKLFKENIFNYCGSCEHPHSLLFWEQMYFRLPNNTVSNAEGVDITNKVTEHDYLMIDIYHNELKSFDQEKNTNICFQYCYLCKQLVEYHLELEVEK